MNVRLLPRGDDLSLYGNVSRLVQASTAGWVTFAAYDDQKSSDFIETLVTAAIACDGVLAIPFIELRS